jgi:uncharacterized membrane protein YdjX (TVP38/TMEM64 family)
MTGNTQKYVLAGYLFLSLAGIAMYKIFGNSVWELFPATDAGEQLFSWSLVPNLGVFTLLFTLTVFFSIPTSPLFCLAAGYFYGVTTGIVVASLATTIGSGASFLLFRKTITPPPSYRSPEVGNLFLLLVLLRCSPWFPSTLITLFCGVSRVRPSLFTASTLFGTIPLISVYTLTASRMRGPFDISILYSPEIITAVAVLGTVSLIGLLRPLRVVTKSLSALTSP